MKRASRYLILAAIALLAVGCHSSRKTTTTVPPTADTTAVTTVPARQYTVLNFSATVEGVSATGQLRVAEDSVMWLSVTKLIELGRALATKDSVWVNAPILDKRFAGSYADLSRYVKQEVTYERLQAIALSDNAGEQLRQMAALMGLDANVRITSRRKENSLKFPFQKFQHP